MTVFMSDIIAVHEDKMSLSPSPSSDAPTTSSSDNEMEPGPNTKCSLCNEMFTIPKVLGCFHTYCQPCLEKHMTSMDKVTCPECHQDTYLTSQGLMGLMPDYAVANIIEALAVDASTIHCTGCKSKETNAMARCFDCANFLCSNCVMAHQFMHCFEGHRVMMLNDHSSTTPADEGRPNKEVYCPRHRTDILRFFCRTCALPICKECTYMEHSRGHEYHLITEVKDKQITMMKQLVEDTKYRAGNLRGTTKNIEYASNRVQGQYSKAQNDINDTYKFYQAMLEEKKQEAMLELDEIYNNKRTSLVGINKRAQESIDRLYQGCDFIEKLLKYASPTEILLFYNFIDQCFQNLFSNIPDLNDQLSSFDLGFVSNYQAIKAGIRNTFGYVRHGSEVLETVIQKPLPIARPNGIVQNCQNNVQQPQMYEPDNSKQYSDNSNNSFYFPPPDPNPYEKWSNGMDIFQNGIDVFSTSADPISEITGKLSSTALYPPKSQIKRQKMIYHCKFGEFGVLEGQFTEPSGVAVNAQNDIIVADTNNHRIQIFDKEGRFKFQFGECGKRDGQLLYPNRVAVVKTSGDIIVTERSPTHQIQIYNQYGQFVRKFGANVLQHPRGVTVDNKGRVIIVECKVMRVIIFDQSGNMLKKFGCSQYLEFPNGVVVNDKEEIFISDNRAHCVKVFNYNGEYLRQLGGEGITNYPIGVGINSSNEILVADNHNNFNLTIFSQDGQLLSALESKVKHAQCFDVSLMDDGSVVLASKDYRLYTYRYTQAPPIGL